MKFLADECSDSGLVEYIRKEGHRVDYIQALLPGVSDAEVLLNPDYSPRNFDVNKAKWK